jgi:hypothetical protein
MINKKNKLPKSTLQIIKFFKDFIRKDRTANFIKKYRKKLKIPNDGLPFTEKDKKELSDPIGILFYAPEKIFSKAENNEEKFNTVRMMNSCMAFVGQEGINSMSMSIMLRLFIIFNKVIDIPLIICGNNEKNDFFKIEHIPTELSWFSKEDHYLLQCMYEHFYETGKKYPVALYINPDASLRQAKDFISKKWGLIKKHRDKNKKSFNKVRTRRKQKRNDFIYNNKNLKIAQIRKKLREELGVCLDDGLIAKIIQLEKKKRRS